MKRGVIIYVLLAILVGHAKGQKLWEKVYYGKDYNFSQVADSDIIGDSIIVVSGFTNILKCSSGVFNLINIKGEEIVSHKEYGLVENCGYFNCYGNFRFVKVTDSCIYSGGEASIDDVVSGDEPVFLRKFDMDGNLKFSVAFHNTELWGHYPIWKTLAMDACDEIGIVIAHSFGLNTNGIIKFDNDGNVQWDKLYDFPIQNILFTENGQFIIYTGNSIHEVSETGEILNSFDIQPEITHFVYWNQNLYLSDLKSIVRHDMENEHAETIFSVTDGGVIRKINIFHNNLWVAYEFEGKLHIVSILQEKSEVWKLPLIPYVVNNFFVTAESLILTGTTAQGQMAVVAYGREELEPVVDWANMELVDIEISNSVIYYEDCHVFGHFFSHITFDTQITIKNNGEDTIHYFELYSYRDGGWGCIKHYFHQYFEDFSLAPGKTKVIDIGNSADYPNHPSLLANYQLCYQLLAPNARLESNIENNILCKTFDVTNVPRVDSHQDWRVYPNPSKDYIKLQFPNQAESSFEIWDIRGKLITSGFIEDGEITIDVSYLINGMYLIRAIQGERIFTKKMVKN